MRQVTWTLHLQKKTSADIFKICISVNICPPRADVCPELEPDANLTKYEKHTMKILNSRKAPLASKSFLRHISKISLSFDVFCTTFFCCKLLYIIHIYIYIILCRVWQAWVHKYHLWSRQYLNVMYILAQVLLKPKVGFCCHFFPPSPLSRGFLLEMYIVIVMLPFNALS